MSVVIDEKDIAPDPVPTRRQKLVATLATIAVFLTVYILSVGPMAGLHRAANFKEFSNTLEFVYRPLVFVVKKDVKPFSIGLKWYISLFR